MYLASGRLSLPIHADSIAACRGLRHKVSQYCTRSTAHQHCTLDRTLVPYRIISQSQYAVRQYWTRRIGRVGPQAADRSAHLVKSRCGKQLRSALVAAYARSVPDIA
eukprot:508294-Rhodomonas_salina.1